MFIKEIDYLSPLITFYHNKKLSHSSILSGILSIITTIIIIVLAVYYFMIFILHKNPEAFYFVRFVDDAGIYPFNSSSLFHFISIKQNNPYAEGLREGIDLTKFRIVGIDANFEKYLGIGDLKQMNHWLYGKCNNNSDIKGISHIIDKDFFIHSACIRKFYNCTEKKYYNTDDPNFNWPILAHGTFHADQVIYNIFIDKCQDESLKEIVGQDQVCNTDAEIAQYFTNSLTTHLYFIDEYIDMLNYKEPNKKFLFKLENNLAQGSCFVNNVNFNPTLIKTQDGYFSDNIKEQMSIVYERNDATILNYGNNIFTLYRFWLNNREQHYERSYKKIQDVISSMGGIGQCIYIFAKFINYIYNYYVVILDTQNLLLSIQSDKKGQKKEVKKTISHNVFNASYIKFLNQLEIPNSNTNIAIYKHKKNIGKTMDNKSKIRIDINNKDNNSNDNKEIKSIQIVDDKKEQINFFDFLIYKILCRKKYSNIKIYEEFRTRIISEEEFLKTFFNVQSMIKINKNVDKKIMYSYKNIS